MLARKQTSIKVDPVAWDEAREILRGYNLTVSDAINIFLNKVRLKKGIPFDVVLPAQEQGSYLNTLRNRSIQIDPMIDVDAVMNEMSDGLSRY
jgi:DNA-damage-inducible protein J